MKCKCGKEKKLVKRKADMVFTDPPYKLTGGGCKTKDITGFLSGDKFKDKKKECLFDVPDFKDWVPLVVNFSNVDSEFFIMSNSRNMFLLHPLLLLEKLKIHNVLIMHKNTGVPHKWYKTVTEFILYYYRGKAINPIGKCGSNVFPVEMPRENKKHPNQKPISFISEIFNNHKNKLVLDPFLGSGSTLIACEKTNRKCFGMELDPHYCSVIIKRWEEFTGKKAVKA